jgi:sugar phosphate isomerase/epimerase
MSISRRRFIHSTLATGILAPFVTQSLISCTTPKTAQFGIQLWTVKEELAKDVKGTLKKLSEYGYTQIESFTGDKGIFWGMAAKDFQAYLNDLGMKMVSSHINPEFTVDPSTEDEFKKLVDDCASIGVTHLFNPYPEPQSSSEDWRKIAQGLNRQGKITDAKGLKIGYHNHHQEFMVTPEGDLPYTILVKETDPDSVQFELDLYWAVKAGQDPEKWFRDNPGRFTFVHLKDLYKPEKIKSLEADSTEARSEVWPVGASTFLGNGQINFAQIIKTGKEFGLTHFIVEQERFDDSTILDDSKKNAEYMKKLLGA